MSSTSSSPVDLLILGAGWTYTFLEPLLNSPSSTLTHLATTRDGRNHTLKWAWDPESGRQQYELLPRAKTVVIVFPIKGRGMSRKIVEGYERVHGKVRWIQLGSSGIWDKGPTLKPDEKRPVLKWTTRDSPYDITNDRAIAEDELLELSDDSWVLNLCGLWGGSRDPRNWISRIATSKEVLASKTSVHFIHGHDVARAILAVHSSPPPSLLLPTFGTDDKKPRKPNRRYLVTDLRIIDWWDLASSTSKYPEINKWVGELMKENDVRALPRTPEQLGRALDSRDFWNDFGLMPERGRYDSGSLL